MRENLPDVLATWVRKVEEAQMLYFAAVIEMRLSGAAQTPLFFGIGPVELKAWFRAPIWRLEGSWKGGEEVVVLGDNIHRHRRLADGVWVRSERLGQINPFGLKRLYCGLEDLDKIDTFFVAENDTGQLWLVTGKIETEEKREDAKWWITKNDHVLRRMERSGRSYFKWKGRHVELPIPILSITYKFWEFPQKVPDELFNVPANAAVQEDENDPLIQWLKHLAG